MSIIKGVAPRVVFLGDGTWWELLLPLEVGSP